MKNSTSSVYSRLYGIQERLQYIIANTGAYAMNCKVSHIIIYDTLMNCPANEKLCHLTDFDFKCKDLIRNLYEKC